jgi:hypothetical protein
MEKIKKCNCVFLQTKVAFTPYPTERGSWRLGQSPCASYWCLKTMTPVGPDEEFVAPEVCQVERSCYEEESFEPLF